MNILQLTAEATPLAKVGGLADVVGELPRSLFSLGLDIHVMMPLHPTIDRHKLDMAPVGEVPVPRGDRFLRAELYRAEVRGVPFLLIDGEPVRAGEHVYNQPEIDAEKYTFFSSAALMAAVELDIVPDILHAHDWHSSPALLKLHTIRNQDSLWKGVRSLLTIHNMPYFGPDCRSVFPAYGIDALQGWPVPEWAGWLALPQAIAHADWLSTVSPTYAEEILTTEYAAGLDDLIRSRQERIVGILNAIDFDIWNPATDEDVPTPFSRLHLKKRLENKRQLQDEMGLPPSDAPLLIMITRIDYQKGIDLALHAMAQLLNRDWQCILLGIGTPELEAQVRGFGDEHPDRVRVVQEFRPTLSHRMYAGADMILMPSRYEPCGLAQMIGMRYGTVPIARATGGLKDTIVDHTSTGEGNGFLFKEPEANACAQAILHALDTYDRPEEWKAVRVRGMAHDFSWKRAAHQYADLYRRIVGASRS